MKAGIYIKGIVDIYIRSAKTGEIIKKKRFYNLVTNAGKELIAYRFATEWTATGGPVIAVGTGTTSPSANDTALENEVFRKTATRTQSANQVQYYVRIDSGEANGYDLAELGVFENADPNARGSGTLVNRVTFTPITKTSDIVLDIYVTFVIG